MTYMSKIKMEDLYNQNLFIFILVVLENQILMIYKYYKNFNKNLSKNYFKFSNKFKKKKMILILIKKKMKKKPIYD